MADSKIEEVPIWQKVYLTLPEAAALFNIGVKQLRALTDDSSQQGLVIYKGTHRLIKRKKLEEYLENITTS